MAISYELHAESAEPPARVFDAVVDLSRWDSYIGVRIRGPQRAVVTGDRIDVGLRVASIDIQCAFFVDLVEPPGDGRAGRVAMGAVEGPVVGTVAGSVVGTDLGGSMLTVAVEGQGRGPVRFVERPLTVILSKWAVHQTRHILSLAAAR
jgi:hypothetical protein